MAVDKELVKVGQKLNKLSIIQFWLRNGSTDNAAISVPNSVTFHSQIGGNGLKLANQTNFDEIRPVKIETGVELNENDAI